MQSSQWKSECHGYVTLVANVFWLEAVNDEMRTRGPSCIIRSKRKTNAPLSFDSIKKEMIECSAFKSIFNIFFVASEEEESPSQRCHCEYLPFNFSFVSLNMWNSFLMKEKDPIYPWNNGIYCEELKTLFDTSFYNAEQLKTMFEASFSNDFYQTSCLLLLYEYLNYGFVIRLNLLFPSTKNCLKIIGLQDIKVEYRRTCIMQSSQWKSECHGYVTLVANVFWLEAVNDEIRTRGPSCIIRSRRKTNAPLSFDSIKKEMIGCSAFKPIFNIFFVASEEEESPSQRCHCEYLPFNFSSVSLNMCNSFLIKGKDLIVGMFSPKVFDVRISKLIFNKHSSKAGIYCKELKTLFDTSFYNAEQLKTIFEVSFGKDSHKINCLILFPYAKTSVWGGVVQKLSVCSMMIKFKKHSISLMFTSDIRSSYSYNLKSIIFNRLFPEVPLIEYFDNNAFGREVFND
ncbi:F-box only protein 22-like isoform X1 [Vespula maculifrons]|uniref:F-box only protein 22-like isoform X1 n=1 Tax=Vespula maculifrons TaxID=7453 RepID=A0ABD2D123_VESMC